MTVKRFFKNRMLWIGCFFIWNYAPNVYAFSIGELQVQSKFGEKFDASFEIDLDYEGPIEVGIGDADDYNKLGVDKQDVVDALIVKSDLPASGLKKKIQIQSETPLFFPSFNLVVWVEHNGGTILENFLITVEFQQNLALNVQGAKNKPENINGESYQGRIVTRKKIPSISKNKTNDNEIVNITKPTQNYPGLPYTKDPIEEIATKKKVFPAVIPAPLKTHTIHRRRTSGVIWANPRDFADINLSSLVSNEVTKIDETNKEEAELIPHFREDKSVGQTNEDYVLKRGEVLFSIAKKLKIKNYHPAQIAVAIWVNNIDKFIFGNIHGIQEGVRLHLEELESHLPNVDLETARRILKNQMVEWELIKHVTPLVTEGKEQRTPLALMPIERFGGLITLFNVVNSWQVAWENMDKESHLDFYKISIKPSPFFTSKKRFLDKHPMPRIKTSSKMLVLKEGIPLVFFKQFFFSPTLKSYGLKELEWSRYQSKWKIRRENFYELGLLNAPPDFSHFGDEKSISLPFVIHVSSHANQISAVRVINYLRSNGFDAYGAPVRISEETEIFRVYVGRFIDWNQAYRVVRILRKKKYGKYATAIPYPFTLQVGDYGSLIDAKVMLESLRKLGYSGFLLVSYEESTGARFKVIVGAFKMEENAIWMMKRLSKSGLKSYLVAP